MTQPEQAVGGGSDDTVIAAEPTIEDRFAAFAQDEGEDEDTEEAVTEQPEDGEAPEPTEDDLDDETDEAPEAEELPPIDPPTSLTAEEKEAFKNWPRDAQESFQRRVGDLEKGFHTKAQELRQTKDEATNHILQMQQTYAQQLEALLPPVPERPSHLLQADDPWTYAEKMDQYENAVAQRQWAQQQLGTIQQQQSQAQQAAREQAMQETAQILQEKFPEYLDPEMGPKLRQELGSIALELGYSAEQLNDVDANDILAMKAVATYKAKAAKYDALQAKKMEKVREAKGMPKVSRPGVSRGKGAAANERYTADREAMRSGDTDAAARVFSRFV